MSEALVSVKNISKTFSANKGMFERKIRSRSKRRFL